MFFQEDAGITNQQTQRSKIAFCFAKNQKEALEKGTFSTFSIGLVKAYCFR